jgi:hypothetical protein
MTMTDNKKKQQKGQKRKRGDSYKSAYAGISFETRESSGRPGSPHRFFNSSYQACISPEIGSNDKPVGESESQSLTNETKTSASPLAQVIHHHSNGLCIITAGETIPSSIKSIQFLVSESPQCSAAEKRKRQAKMLKGSNVQGVVSPSTVIAKLELESGESVPIYACVWGAVLELNRELTPQVLAQDPLLDGHLAIILPSGTFPPRKEAQHENEQDQEATQPAKEAKIE